jgi:hypothetical protein
VTISKRSPTPGITNIPAARPDSVITSPFIANEYETGDEETPPPSPFPSGNSKSGIILPKSKSDKKPISPNSKPIAITMTIMLTIPDNIFPP